MIWWKKGPSCVKKMSLREGGKEEQNNEGRTAQSGGQFLISTSTEGALNRNLKSKVKVEMCIWNRSRLNVKYPKELQFS